MTEPQAPATPSAVRLIFEYDGDDVRLVSQQPVDIAISGFDVPPEVRAGHFVDTRDENGTRLSRVSVRGAFQQSAEVFPEDHAEPITRVDTPVQGAFTVVVPAPPAAAQVAVVRVAAAPPASAPGGGTTSPAPGTPEDVTLGTFRLER
jgi:hypothetical protein